MLSSLSPTVSPKMSTDLPVELWEIIFDQFSTSKSTLKACSLVCRAWMRIAWKRLFHTISLRYPRWKQPKAPPPVSSWNFPWALFRRQTPETSLVGAAVQGWAPMLSFFNSPRRPTQYTIEIKIILPLSEFVVGPPPAFFVAGSFRFPRLRDVHVYAPNNYRQTGGSWAHLHNIISHVTSLELDCVNFRSFNDFITLLASSRCTELTVEDATWESRDIIQLSHWLHPPPIRRLSLVQIEIWAITAFCDWLDRFNRLQNIHTLVLHVLEYPSEWCEGDNVLLRRCTAMRRLEMKVDACSFDILPSWDYSSCFALREFSITSYLSDSIAVASPCKCIFEMLQRLPRPRTLESIELNIDDLERVHLSWAQPHCCQLDDYLIDLSHHALKSVVVFLCQYSFPTLTTAVDLQAVFPKLYHAGVVRDGL